MQPFKEFLDKVRNPNQPRFGGVFTAPQVFLLLVFLPVAVWVLTRWGLWAGLGVVGLGYVATFLIRPFSLPAATPSQPPLAGQRPPPLSFICVVNFVILGIYLMGFFDPNAAELSKPFDTSLRLAALVAGLVAVFGIWQMQRWAVWLYAGYVALDVWAYFQVAREFPVSFSILWLITLAISLLAYRRMYRMTYFEKTN